MATTYADNGAVTHLYEGTEEPVQVGDRIRTRQYPGGILPASQDWTYGVAAIFPRSDEERARIDAFNAAQGSIVIDPDELVCQCLVPLPYGEARVAYAYIHEVERVA